MKKAILLVLLFLSTSAFAQFDLPTYLGGAIEVNSKFDYTLYNEAVTITPQWQIDKFIIANQTTSLISDSATVLFSGLKLGYEVWNDNADKSISVSAHGLAGFEKGDALSGLGINYNTGNISLMLDGSQRYKTKTFVGTVSVGYFLNDRAARKKKDYHLIK